MMSRNLRKRRAASAGDRGAVLIVFALSLVAICAVIALVLGGSVGYSAERNSQTSSDAAALAATSKLRSFQLGEAGVTADAILTTAVDVAEDNGADVGDVQCEIVRPDRSVIGPCTPANVSNASAAGVRVSTADTREAPFGEVTGAGVITGATGATATIQPLITGNSPFMVCSSTGGTDGHPIAVLESSPPYEIKQAAIGQSFMLWANGVDMDRGNRACGGRSSSWSGWVDNSREYELPGWWDVRTGAAVGHLIPRVLLDPDACGAEPGDDLPDLDGCVLMVPLCVESNGASGTRLEFRCVRFGAFELSYHFNGDTTTVPCMRGSDRANKVMCGKLLEGRTSGQGQGSNEQAGANDVVVIKLVE